MRDEWCNQKEANGGRAPARNHRTVVQQSNSPRLKLEREQKRGRKAEGKKRTRIGSFKTTEAKIDNAMTRSVAEETRNATSAGDNRARSDEGSRKNKHGDDTTAAEGRVGTMQPLCYGDRQGEELLCLQRFWAYGLTLLKWGQRGRMEEGRRLEYGGGREGHYEHLDNLKGEENLESLD